MPKLSSIWNRSAPSGLCRPLRRLYKLSCTEFLGLRCAPPQALCRRPLRGLFIAECADECARGGGRYLPYAFTEQGVTMLSSVLRSERAIEVNIAIMRAFVKLRQMLESNEKLNQKFAAVIRKLATHDKYFIVVFDELESTDYADYADSIRHFIQGKAGSGRKVLADQLLALTLLNLCNLRNLWMVVWSPTANPKARPVETLAAGPSYDQIDESDRLSQQWLGRRSQVARD